MTEYGLQMTDCKCRAQIPPETALMGRPAGGCPAGLSHTGPRPAVAVCALQEVYFISCPLQEMKYTSCILSGMQACSCSCAGRRIAHAQSPGFQV